MNKLSEKTHAVQVPGKLILIGEHSVVYGHTAIAMPLLGINLTLTIHSHTVKSWDEAWQASMHGHTLTLNEHFLTSLKTALTLTLKLFGFDLNSFTPQAFSIDSHLPLGGGLGGSAALSASFVKLCAKLFHKHLDLKTEIEYANQVDSLFHSGRASGLDVATVLTKKLIKYKKNTFITQIKNKCSFFVALVDTEERTETRKMIEKVSALLSEKQEYTEDIMKELNTLATECETCLKTNNLKTFSYNLNLAQNCLVKLGVSTQKTDEICTDLRVKGALCAKLTGAGGGGLVLSVFEENPEFLKKFYPTEKLYITEISPD